ncbi:MAG: GTPase Era [Micavibrio aeruginosavorus]|uniref:GTPase Era n=1 Tax=Micavibrio aeruginosavorus TaxID=349221 RepID=A0A2W5FJC7_9BACT|nr:MAG: GTPase Era [Micavibrio aeruginosavorus]
MTDQQTRCGYVAILGAPNAGKSTLVNQMVGAKVSIVSRKVQTTRNRILGIFIEEQTQVVLMDTPGLFKPSTRLERAMVSAAWGSSEEADLTLYIVDASRPFSNKDNEVLKKLKSLNLKQVWLVLNKGDAISPQAFLDLAAKLNAEYDFGQTFMISALKGNGVKDLIRNIGKNLPQGPWLFAEDQMTDLPMRLLAAEITREQIFNQLHEELPYSTTVQTEEWEQFENGDVRIRQIIHVERDSQKGIVVGKGGSKLKQIGTASRKELEEIIESKVHLNLFVRVSEKWHDNPEYYSEWGLDHDA